MNGSGSTTSKVIIDVVFKVLALLILPTLMWAVRLEIRVSAIEADRFTSKDGLEVWRQLEKRPIRNEIPPSWFLEDVNELKRRVERLEDD